MKKLLLSIAFVLTFVWGTQAIKTFEEIVIGDQKMEQVFRNAEYHCIIISGCGAEAQWCDVPWQEDDVWEYTERFMDHFC